MRSFVFLFLIFSSLMAHNYSLRFKEKKIYPMGKRIYETVCKRISLQNYDSYEKLLNDIPDFCISLNQQHKEALALYLWEIKKNPQDLLPPLQVQKDQRCPVCGMFLYKYPNWITSLKYQNEQLYFDGVKDMLRYFFQHPQGVLKVLVQDYYTQKTIDGSKAFYVIGSDLYGPMGKELIPFKTKKGAQQFLLDHRAKSILRFDQLDKTIFLELEQ